ncbi:Na+/H+ antiporter NhaC family protein [Lacticaseibacillus baoqingensis]|uniref:Na+/H+ antiporter NhaC family protein n=1 Tax=Lacticaseibacillus baoqingensis TaxID=2486013 RepID=A0ABW4E7U0_9LACO|nr:Na+/H+ antiporter NhaC family protein [Lacticaseibacillus baoqingensis]
MVAQIVVVFILLLACVLQGWPLAWGLAVGWVVFACGAQQAIGWRQVLAVSWQGLRTAWVVVRTLTLIGALIGAWMASGTIATIVALTFRLVTPSTFVVMTFVICAVVSTIIGTSFGTLSVVGVPLMIVARSGRIDLEVVAGAIIAGIYVGDRCSPLSSSASLVAAVTGTHLSQNVRQMLKTGWLPLGLAVIGYAGLSWRSPLAHLQANLLTALAHDFVLAWWQLLPAAIVIGLAILRRPISESILMSLVVTMLLGHFGQHTPWSTLLWAMLAGFHPAGAHPVAGGGISSMLTAISVVLVSCALAGVLNATSTIQGLEQRMQRQKLTPQRRFWLTGVVALVTAGFGCNQSVAVILTNTLMRPQYGQERQALASDIENTAIVLAPLIPWNIAVFVPTTVLGVSFAGYWPYALFLYLVPLCNWLLAKKPRRQAAP